MCGDNVDARGQMQIKRRVTELCRQYSGMNINGQPTACHLSP